MANFEKKSTGSSVAGMNSSTTRPSPANVDKKHVYNPLDRRKPISNPERNKSSNFNSPLDRRKEAQMKAEAEVKAEAQRKLEALRKSEALRKAEDLKKSEVLRKAEAWRKAEELKKAEALRKAEARRKMEVMKKAIARKVVDQNIKNNSFVDNDINQRYKEVSAQRVSNKHTSPQKRTLKQHKDTTAQRGSSNCNKHTSPHKQTSPQKLTSTQYKEITSRKVTNPYAELMKPKK